MTKTSKKMHDFSVYNTISKRKGEGVGQLAPSPPNLNPLRFLVYPKPFFVT